LSIIYIYKILCAFRTWYIVKTKKTMLYTFLTIMLLIIGHLKIAIWAVAYTFIMMKIIRINATFTFLRFYKLIACLTIYTVIRNTFWISLSISWETSVTFLWRCTDLTKFHFTTWMTWAVYLSYKMISRALTYASRLY
jgi:hypothetical protein